MKVFKNPNSDFHVLLWANQDEIPGLPVAIINKKTKRGYSYGFNGNT